MAGQKKVYVIGVGMTKFEKPGRRDDFDYPDMALEAGTKALKDAGISYAEVEQAAVGYCYGDTTCGQRALYQLGMTGIPIYNVNNACSTGSSALVLGKQLIEGGIVNCVMAMGFEKMQRGSLSSTYADRVNPMDKHVEAMCANWEIESGPITAQMFGNAGREHMQKYGTKPEHFAKVAWKNHKHSVNNPPTSDGAACCILASEEFVKSHNLQAQAVEIMAQQMCTDYPSTFKDKNATKVIGYDMTKNCSNLLFKKAGLTPDDVQVVELHDCFSANELVSYEAIGLCAEGKAGEMIDRGDNTYGGKYVVNPSGGLISKGHPLGATGLAQCTELCWQLRGTAGKRQVPNVKVALQHNVGLGGAVVMALYRMGFPEYAQASISGQSAIAASPTSAQASDFRVSTVFDIIDGQLKQNGAEYVKKVGGVFCFKVKKGSDMGVWVVDVKNGTGSVKFDPNGKGDVTITISDEDLIKLMSGTLNPQQAFFQGKLKIAGNMGLAMKMRELQPSNLKSKL